MVGWLTGWSYRKKITIQENAGQDLTDYQIKITVHYGFGTDSDGDIYLGGKCRSDFGDIRFTAGDGKTLLSYWMEEKVDGDYAIFWVKVPSIPANGTSDIYIYYGNSGATYAGSGDDTFLFFDDFEAGNLDKWVQDAGNGYIQLETTKPLEGSYSARLGQPVNDEDHVFMYENVSRDNIAIHAKAYIDDAVDAGRALLYARGSGERGTTKPRHAASCYIAGISSRDDVAEIRKNDSVGEEYQLASTSMTVDLDTEYDLEFRLYGSTLKLLVNGEEKVSVTDTDFASGYSGLYVVESETIFDLVYIRKYVDPEPSISEIGNEEVQVGWLKGWQYRKKHDINGSTAGGVTDYQIRVKVHYGSGEDSGEDVYLNGKCRSDFGDVRFTADDGVTELPYWMEEKVDGDYAIFWVKVPSIPASPDVASIYVYYGNPDAVYVGDGESTFLFFDDFEDGVLDTSKWALATPYPSGATVTEHDGVLDVYKRRYPYTVQEFPDPIVIEEKINQASDYAYNVPVTRFDGQAASGDFYNPYNGFYVKSDPPGEFVLRKEINGTKYDLDSYTEAYPPNTWCRVTFKDGKDKYTTRVLVDGEERLTTTDSTTFAKNHVSPGAAHEEAGTHLYVEWFAIRKYIDPEPSHGAWYAEETPIIVIELSDLVIPCDAIGRGVGVSRLDGVKGVDVLVRGVSLVEVELAKAAEVVEVSPMLVFSGIVQTPLGDPYPNAKVLAIDEETWEVVGKTTSDADGKWSMILPGGRRYTFVAVGAELNVGADAKAHVKY